MRRVGGVCKKRKSVYALFRFLLQPTSIISTAQSLRLNNYKGKIDKELLLKQNNNFQKAVKTFVNNQSLENFANIPCAKSVDWVIANKKYFLKKSFMSKLCYFFQII